MTAINYLRSNRKVTMHEAALLFIHEDPSAYLPRRPNMKVPDRYFMALRTLERAIVDTELNADPLVNASDENGDEVSTVLDLESTRVALPELRAWFRERGSSVGFYETPYVAHLDNYDSHYSAKLAAALGAWDAAHSALKKSSAKSAKEEIENWLIAHEKQFKLSKQAIKEVAKVANWNTKGGARKTRSRTN